MRIGVLVLLFAAVRCSFSTDISTDPDMNYKWVFYTMPQPRPFIVNSRVERMKRCCFLGPQNGDYEFEVYAPRPWVETALVGYSQIQWKEFHQRAVPEWFQPSPETFTVWQTNKKTSFPEDHIFVEGQPHDESRIHVYIQRH
jgi:hypothetical protein